MSGAYGTRRARTLKFCERPRTNAELAELLCDHSGAVARDMSKLQHLGLIVNLNPGKGKTAIYQTREPSPHV